MFKPLGLAAAVAAVTAGYAGVSQAQGIDLANNSLGDAAIVPYYTVAGDYVTGVHIINTSNWTQVVKLRLRRGSDSMDALDFNIILSPYDEWTGYVDDNGGMGIRTEDTSCTAPLRADGYFAMPGLYRAGADEGYMEIIAMGAADENQPISVAAKHTDEGVPLNCSLVESNFFRNATSSPVAYSPAGNKGITSSDSSNQTCSDAIAYATGAIGFGETCASQGIKVLGNDYEDPDNVLKVSYFIRDAASGLEFGNSAVHLQDFSVSSSGPAGSTSGAFMTNQEIIVVGQSDAFGYLFPDLDGGSPIDTGRGRFEEVRSTLGATSIINDWSVATARNVSTDWVVTLPGQYLMLDLAQYTTSLFDEDEDCLTVEQAEADSDLDPNNDEYYCDERDLPVELFIDVWNREEGTFTNPDSGLVISPSVTNAPSEDTLENEVNVIQWTDGSTVPVLPSAYAKSYDASALGAEFGWAKLSVSAASNKTQGIYNFLLSGQADYAVFDSLVHTAVPIVGFVAWERSFPSDPSANYGRIVEHSYESF